MFGIGARRGERNLVGAKRPFDLVAVYNLGTGPALRRRQDDHRPRGTRRPATRARGGLDVADGLQHGVERPRHLHVQQRRIVPFDEVRLPSAASQQLRELAAWNPREHGWVRDLVAVQVQDRQHRAVGRRIEKLVRVPRGGQRAGFGFTVADHAGRDQIGIVEDRAEGVAQRVSQLPAFVNAAGRFRRHVTGDAAGERELAEERREPGAISRDLRIHLGVGAFEVDVGDHRRTAVARSRQIDHVEIPRGDDAVQVRVDEVLPGCRAPVAEQARLDVRRLQRLQQQRVVEQVNLADGQVVGGAPVRVQQPQRFG